MNNIFSRVEQSINGAQLAIMGEPVVYQVVATGVRYSISACFHSSYQRLKVQDGIKITGQEIAFELAASSLPARPRRYDRITRQDGSAYEVAEYEPMAGGWVRVFCHIAEARDE